MPAGDYDYVRSGKVRRSNGTEANAADGINPDGSQNTVATGSHIELGKGSNVKVAAGSTVTVVPQVKFDQVRRAYGYAVTKSAEPHTFTVKVEHQNVGGTAGMNGFADGAASIASAGGARANTGQFDVRSMYAILTVTNGDASDRYYDGVIGGFRQ